MAMPERRCGTCASCLRLEHGRTTTRDPWAWLGEPLRSTLRRVAGICCEEGQVPCGVELDWEIDEMPCEGVGWEVDA